MDPFHLAFAIDDIEPTRRFYRDVLGCRVGREAPNWIDFEFFGHQISAHVHPGPRPEGRSRVDDETVPLHHFGAVLAWERWDRLADRIVQAGWAFERAPHVRFAGEPGEQGTFFVLDPSGNALEFKAFRDPAEVYARPDQDDRG